MAGLFGCDDVVGPGGKPVEHLGADIFVLAAGPGRHVKGVIGIRKNYQGGASAERFADRLDLVEHRELVARALQEQHRDLDVEQVVTTFLRRTSGWMQRKSEERQTANA